MRLFHGHVGALREAGFLLTHHRELTFEMARREVSDRYAGQALGAMWAVGHPIFMTGLYVFVFAVVFKTKIGGTFEMPLDYTTYLLSGLIPWMAFQESMNKSCTAIAANASLVKQVVFPLEVLPAKGVIASLLPQFISTTILIAYVLIVHKTLFATHALLPILIFLQILDMLGTAYLLSAVGAYFRDVKDLVQLFCMAGVYLVPVVYLPGWTPRIFRPVLYLNPFSYPIWCYQDALYFGRFEHPWAWIVNGFVSVAIFVFGYRLFRKLKSGFGNTL
jgi:lipopolysaccharide transport system permease protein